MVKAQRHSAGAASHLIALLLTLITTLGATPAGAANDELTLPPPTYPDVARLLDTGDHAAALDRLTAVVQDGPGQPLEALVLRATLLAHVGRGPDAETVWRQVIDREVWMRTFSRRALVTSLAGRGEPALAAPTLSELNRSDRTRHLDLTLLVADAHRDRAEFPRAAALYRDALGRLTRGALADRARLGLAAAQEGADDLTAAIAILRDAQARAPDRARLRGRIRRRAASEPAAGPAARPVHPDRVPDHDPSSAERLPLRRGRGAD